MTPARIHPPLAAICALLALVLATLAPGLHSHDRPDDSHHAIVLSACDTHDCDHHDPAHHHEQPQHCPTCELLLLSLSAPPAAPPLTITAIAPASRPSALPYLGLIEAHRHPRALPARGPPLA